MRHLKLKIKWHSCQLWVHVISCQPRNFSMGINMGLTAHPLPITSSCPLFMSTSCQWQLGPQSDLKDVSGSCLRRTRQHGEQLSAPASPRWLYRIARPGGHVPRRGGQCHDKLSILSVTVVGSPGGSGGGEERREWTHASSLSFITSSRECRTAGHGEHRL